MRDQSYGALLDAVRGVHWPARHAVVTPISGAHHSRLRGTSAEFSEYRLYAQGDDPRRLDWRLLARSDRAYIRLATDRAILPTTIVLDSSASMAYPSATLAKWRVAQSIVVGLGAIAHGDGDPVGVAVQDEEGRAHQLPPRTRRGVVGEIARVVGAAESKGLAPLAPTLAGVRSARVVLVTDLLGDADELLRVARLHIVGGGEVHLVHIVAREELDPPRRAILAADPELPAVERLLVDATRGGYDVAFASWRGDMARRWRAAGAAFTEVVTDEAPAHALRRIAEPAAAGVGGGER